ncbi:MAG: hypothetical protein WCC10_14740 [Tumebacillaceae bacterium]
MHPLSTPKLKLIVQDLDLGVNEQENMVLLMERLDSQQLDIQDLLQEVDRIAFRKQRTLNLIALTCWENGLHDYVIPFLQQALDYGPRDADTLFNLGFILSCLNEHRLSLQFLDRIENKDSEIIALIEEVKLQANRIPF